MMMSKNNHNNNKLLNKYKIIRIWSNNKIKINSKSKDKILLTFLITYNGEIKIRMSTNNNKNKYNLILTRNLIFLIYITKENLSKSIQIHSHNNLINFKWIMVKINKIFSNLIKIPTINFNKIKCS